MKVNVTMTGAQDLRKRLDSLPHALSRKVQVQALKKGAEPIRAMAASLAPRSEGSGEHLADHIIIAVPSESQLGDEGLFDTAAVHIGPARRFFYGSFREFGTAFQPARPFLRPAFDSQTGRSMNIVLAETWAAIRKALAIGGGRSTTGGNL